MHADKLDKEFKYKELTAKIISACTAYRQAGVRQGNFLQRTRSVFNEAQLLNYLKATDIEVGLLFNFGPEPEIKRKAFDNRRKRNLKNLDNLRLSAS